MVGTKYEKSYDELDPNARLFLGITPAISQAMDLARSTPGYGGSIEGVSAKYAKVPYDEQLLTERDVNQLRVTIGAPVIGVITSMLMNNCSLISIFPDGALVAFDNGGGRERPRLRIMSADPEELSLPLDEEMPMLLVELIGEVVNVSGFAFEDVWAAMSEDEIRDTMSLRSISLIASAILEFAKKALSSPGQN